MWSSHTRPIPIQSSESSRGDRSQLKTVYMVTESNRNSSSFFDPTYNANQQPPNPYILSNLRPNAQVSHSPLSATSVIPITRYIQSHLEQIHPDTYRVSQLLLQSSFSGHQTVPTPPVTTFQPQLPPSWTPSPTPGIGEIRPSYPANNIKHNVLSFSHQTPISTSFSEHETISKAAHVSNKNIVLLSKIETESSVMSSKDSNIPVSEAGNTQASVPRSETGEKQTAIQDRSVNEQEKSLPPISTFITPAFPVKEYLTVELPPPTPSQNTRNSVFVSNSLHYQPLINSYPASHWQFLSNPQHLAMLSQNAFHPHPSSIHTLPPVHLFSDLQSVALPAQSTQTFQLQSEAQEVMEHNQSPVNENLSSCSPPTNANTGNEPVDVKSHLSNDTLTYRHHPEKHHFVKKHSRGSSKHKNRGWLRQNRLFHDRLHASGFRVLEGNNGTKVCSFCNQHFSKEMFVWRHALQHVGEKPFYCSVCDQRFTRSDTLQRHIRRLGHHDSQCESP